MRFFLLFALASPLAAWPAHPAAAQTPAPAAGRLHYESTQRVDQNQVKITLLDNNGQELKTDVELPSSISASQTLLYVDGYAREEHAREFQMAGGNIRLEGPKGPGPTASKPAAGPTEATYLDLTARTATAVTTLGSTAYALPPVPVPPPPPGWRDLSQTRKILGYTCHKVTVPYHHETYTLWVTTELPFAYSPVRALTPAQGVVLALSSDQEEYRATQLVAEPVAAAAVRPGPQTQPITAAALQDLKAKARADQRQQELEQATSPAAH